VGTARAFPKMRSPQNFEVRAGQVTYLGSYELTTIVGQTLLFHLPMPSAVALSGVDAYRRDRDALLSARPELNNFPMENEAPHVAPSLREYSLFPH